MPTGRRIFTKSSSAFVPASGLVLVQGAPPGTPQGIPPRRWRPIFDGLSPASPPRPGRKLCGQFRTQVLPFAVPGLFIGQSDPSDIVDPCRRANIDSETSASDSETPRPSDSETCRPSDSETSASDSETSRPSDSETRYPSDSETPMPLGFGNFEALGFETPSLGFGNLPIPTDSETSASDSETSRPSDSETCLSPRIRKLPRRIRKLPGPRIRKLPGPRIRKLAVLGFGNYQALGFGNLPFPPDSETSTSDSETSRPRIRKLCHRQTASSINISIYWILDDQPFGWHQ